MPSSSASTPQAAPTQQQDSAKRQWKGFELDSLKPLGVRRVSGGVEIPYFTRRGTRWRSKLFRDDGRSYWLGDRRAQIPYGLETLKLGGDAVVLTEGESDALALRLAFPKLPVLGVPGASSWRNEWTTCLDDFHAIYLSFDADRAGEKLAASVLDTLPYARTINLPAGADTRDVLQRLGRNAYATLVKEARIAGQWRELGHEWNAVNRQRAAVDDAWKAAG